MRASDLIILTTADPQRTARSWLEASSGFPASLDPAEFLLLACQHRLCGLLADALREADWFDRLPITVCERLDQEARLAELRQRELTAALRQLADVRPDIVSRSVLLKGGGLLADYGRPGHRPMNDFDILLGAEDFAELEPHFAELGYWLKVSLNGPTFYRESDSPTGTLCLDVHVAGPSKYFRPEEALTTDWISSAEKHSVDGIACLRAAPDFEFVNVVTHIHEHLASWYHTVDDDDVRLIRFIDAEVLLARGAVDPEGCWRRAVDLGLQGEFALGLWAWSAVRGGLPDALAPLAPLAARVAGLGEQCAMPFGRTVRWSVPLRERAFRTDRLELAFDLLGKDEDRRWSHWQEWYATRGMLDEDREKVEVFGEEARRLVDGFTPAAPPA
ncbi:nucleotidyltransferase family protein [Streptomyces sp. NRRL F-5123]|uniref:nucleotidyltransferase family protein n=1 Tax=Streptomyces sp. NRRL F-5123 TaxID=1463856 RepID=UPI0004E11515|nr:nucleotidyltransferase family protein [Streptomyces sp. NRRL F-5123]